MSDPFWQLNAQALKTSKGIDSLNLLRVLSDRIRKRRKGIEGRFERKERPPMGVDKRNKLRLGELPEELCCVLMERGRCREL